MVELLLEDPMKKYFFDDDWKNWIWSNIKNGVSKQKIYNDLLAKNFDVFTVINELRFIPDVFRKEDAIPCNQVMGYLHSAEAIKVDLPIPFFIIPDFLSDVECQEIVEIQKTNYSCVVTDEKKENSPVFTTYFETTQSDANNTTLQMLKQKILSLMGIPIRYAEKPQGQWYKESGFFQDHFDAYDDYDGFKSLSGNRTWTCHITLNRVAEGGDTYFSKLDKRFKAKTGQALIWYNLNENGLAHPLTLHTEQAVIQGEKFMITQWFRQA